MVKLRSPAAVMFLVAVLLVASASVQAQTVDRSSLIGRILRGYQGWFSTPCADGSGGWDHWSRSRDDIGPGFYYTDLWPDITEYDAADLCPCPNVTLASGNPAYLFSNSRQGVTNTHFRWMQENNIDGVFIGRFVAGRRPTRSRVPR